MQKRVRKSKRRDEMSERRKGNWHLSRVRRVNQVAHIHGVNANY